jgi:DNA polymerase-1
LTFDQVLGLFDTQEILYVDTETNGEEIRDGRGYCQGVSFGLGFEGVSLASTYLPFRHRNGANLDPVRLHELKRKFEKYEGHVTFHNAKHDLVSLGTLGIDYRGPFYCTMIMSHMANENLYSQSLDSLCLSRLKREGKKKSDIFQAALKYYGWGGIPSEVIFEYAATDAELLVPLLDNVIKDWESQEMPWELWEHRQKFIRDVVIPMEARGIRVDTELCKRMTVHGETTMQELLDMIGLNLGSPKDQYELFINRLKLPVLKTSKKTGNPSFDKEVMREYETILERNYNGNPTAEYVLAYRGWQKSVSSNYKPYVNLLSPDGRLRPNYKLHGTKTGRLSCELPNLQQIPKSGEKAWNGEMKKAFIPSEGYELWEFDYAQLELRLGTAYAKEEKLLEVFADPTRDVFTEMSKQVGMNRFDTKTLTYSMQYGAGENRIKNVFGVSAQRAREIRDNYFNTYPNFAIITKHAARRAVKAGKVQLWTKRYRHFMWPQSESHKAFNAVIQGGAADIVERVMVRISGCGFDPTECRMLLQVHDSIVFEIRKEKVDYYTSRIRELMEDVQPDFGVKFKVDVHEWGK